MEPSERKRHWEQVYHTKALHEVSWYQPVPTTSLELIKALDLPKEAALLDVGGGDSFLVDNLLEMGYHDLTVLDISEAAIDRARARLGPLAHRVHWIVADITTFSPHRKYDLWHDRAAFHFILGKDEIGRYVNAAREALHATGHLIIGTFSDQGPTRCSGLEITQYSPARLGERFAPAFRKETCITVEHPTPFNTRQQFTFCSFSKAEPAPPEGKRGVDTPVTDH